MDIKKKRQVPGGQGSAASEEHLDVFVKAGSWQYGANATAEAIEAEKKENDLRFGVPHANAYKNPADSGFDADATLPNPNNFSNNPGYMTASTGDMATSGTPANGGTARVATSGAPSSAPGRSLRSVGGRETWGGSTGSPSNVKSGSTVGRSTSLGSGNAVLPAPGDTDPGQEGGPQIVSSGYSG